MSPNTTSFETLAQPPFTPTVSIVNTGLSFAGDQSSTYGEASNKSAPGKELNLQASTMLVSEPSNSVSQPLW